MAGPQMPPLLYGTAWKEDRTASLVTKALAAGFRGIDTANQRKHYHEAGVGEAVRGAIEAGLLNRDELFLQTKFTFRHGQDQRLPYDPAAPVSTQVRQSFESSLEHLHVDRLDSLVLHGPSTYPGLGAADWDAWHAMEDLVDSGLVGIIGLSNVTVDQLCAFHEGATVKPAVVQNRTFTRPVADRDVRAFCTEQGIAYQAFSLLTAIPHIVQDPALAALARRLGATTAQVVFAYVLGRGMHVLTGTTSSEHMKEDLSTGGVALPPDVYGALDRATGYTS